MCHDAGLSGFLSIEDLFAAGIGFDIGGACLVALGLMTSPRQIADFITVWKYGNPYLGLAAIDDKINGESGVFFLVVGFLLQAAGYVATASLTVSDVAGTREAVGVAAFVGIAFLATTLGARLWRKFRRRRLIVEVAHYDAVPRVRMPLPTEGRLEIFAEALGAESLGDWFDARREAFNNNFFEAKFERYTTLFGVKDFLTGPDPYWKASDVRTASQIPPPAGSGIPQYTAAEYGERLEVPRGILRRVFG